MTESTESGARETTFGQDLITFIRHHLRGWRGIAAAGVVLAGPALWLGGPWLVAVGGLSLLVSLAPCLIMCGLGFCMMKSCDKKAKAGKDAAQDAGPVAPVEVPPAASASAMKEAEDPASR